MSTGALPKEVAERVKAIAEHIEAGRLDQAAYGMKKIPQAWAGHAAVWMIRGEFDYAVGLVEQGLKYAQNALRLEPENEDFVRRFCDLLWSTGKRSEAVALVEGFLEGHPKSVLILKKASDCYHKLGMSPRSYHFALRYAKATPEVGEAKFVQAYRATDLRRYEEGLRLFAEAAELMPEDSRSGSGRVFAMLYAGVDPRVIRETTERWCNLVYGGVKKGKVRSAKELVGKGKLRVGYVSGDFRSHVVMSFFRRVLELHDRERVEVWCYSNTDTPDAVTDDLREMIVRRGGGWREILGMSDDAAAEAIRRDGIDVLVDLGGLSGSGRTGIFARRAAPVQATYLGYPATTGISEMDYRITDGVADPVGETEAFHTEKLWRLERCAWAYEPVMDPGLEFQAQPPSASGNGFIFGSFNLLTKVNQASTALWSRVLAESEKRGKVARMLMTDRRGLLDDEEGVEILRREFSAGGASLDRVMLANWMPTVRGQRERLKDVDLMLDPLSYNGTTTTCEAMWDGVPTLTFPGKAHVSRVGASLLRAVGLEEFVARDERDFVEKAIRWVEDPSRLVEIRKGLRERVRASELGDFAGLARAVEGAYLGMVREKAGGST